MERRVAMSVVGLLAIVSLVIAGCAPVTPPPPAVPRTTGPWLDEVVITRQPMASAGVGQLQANQIDLYATSLAVPALLTTVQADPNLAYNISYGTYLELTFNPAGPVHPVGNKLNPLASPQIREAFNWLISREYIAGTIMGGLGQPRYTALNPNFADAASRYAPEHAALVAHYAHNITRAVAAIHAGMLALNASGPAAGNITNRGNVTHPVWFWHNGTVDEQVSLRILIRTEDERLPLGHYVNSLILAHTGFATTLTLGTGAVLAPIWQGEPAASDWRIVTAGWVSTVISRDEGWLFGGMYTDLWAFAMGPLWAAYGRNQTFFPAAEKLWNNDFTSMAERRALFLECMNATMKDSVRVFVATRLGFGPYRDTIRLASDAAGGPHGSWMWALTAHFRNMTAPHNPLLGGRLRVAMVDLLVHPWNPVAGTNWVFDMFPIRATGDMATLPDTRDGLRWPQRMGGAQVFVQAGLPVGVTHAWVNLTFRPAGTAELIAPLDAWADWNATTQRFVRVADAINSTNPNFIPGFNRTARAMARVFYPKEVFNQTLHDGSKLSMGDFILHAILEFDRAKNASAIFDPATVSAFNAFMGNFRGVRFITTDPNWGLIVETWTNSIDLDAEITAEASAWFPNYAQGPGVWHTIALGIRAEAAGQLAFGTARATALGVEWTNFIAGPSIGILKSHLANATAVGFIPYAPTMGLFVNATEISQRWTNLNTWVNARNHFWVASGPFYLFAADTVTDMVHLKRHLEDQDPIGRWMFLFDPLP